MCLTPVALVFLLDIPDPEECIGYYIRLEMIIHEDLFLNSGEFKQCFLTNVCLEDLYVVAETKSQLF